VRAKTIIEDLTDEFERVADLADTPAGKARMEWNKFVDGRRASWKRFYASKDGKRVDALSLKDAFKAFKRAIPKGGA